MSKYGRSSDLGQFIFDQLYNQIYEAIKGYSFSHKEELEFSKDEFRRGFLTLEDIFFKFAENVSIIDDTVIFDAIIEGNFSTQVKYRGDYDYDSESLWYRLSCEMNITDKLNDFKIYKTEQYTKEQRKNTSFPATANFVPIISKNEFDSEAERFLKKWCPDALRMPMAVPIEMIVAKMGLKIVRDKMLTKDLNVFGQICFSDGSIKTYDEEKEAYIDTPVERGTVFIDPNTFYLRNLGCLNNTLAHEAFHWERHRIYATIKGILTKQPMISCRCPTAPKGNIIKNLLSDDEDWMEWQANGIAPKILMPKSATELKIKELVKKYQYNLSDFDSSQKLTEIIDELADFYQVSKQAAKIRMIELGYTEAMNVYNYTSSDVYLTNLASVIDVFEEYQNNNDLKTILDLGLFRNVEGYYVIDNPLYRTQTDDCEYRLTNYAKKNLSDCTLTFSYNILELFEFNREQGVMYRNQRQARATKFFSPEYNQESIDRALAKVAICQQQIEAAQDFCAETLTQTIVRYMATKKWNSSIFQTRTGLNASTYRKITNKPNGKLELPIIISICVGLGLSSELARELVFKAGYALGNTPEDYAYSMIINGSVSDNILSCNAFIEEVEKRNPGYKIRRLGSSTYDG